MEICESYNKLAWKEATNTGLEEQLKIFEDCFRFVTTPNDDEITYHILDKVTKDICEIYPI